MKFVTVFPVLPLLLRILKALSPYDKTQNSSFDQTQNSSCDNSSGNKPQKLTILNYDNIRKKTKFDKTQNSNSDNLKF